MRLLREITTGKLPAPATRTVQRAIIDKVLELVPKKEDTSPAASPTQHSKKRARDDDISSSADLSEEDSEGPLETYPKSIKIPKRSGRAKQPTEKAKAAPRKKSAVSAKAEPESS